MYKTYTTFRPETGEIIGWVSDHEPPIEPGHIESPTGGPIDGRLFYVKGGAVLPRPENTARLGGRLLDALPVPCTITINGKAYPCNSTYAELSFTYPGTYAIKVSAFPRVDAHFEVKV